MVDSFMGHGDRPNYDIHLANGSFRIAKTPSGRAFIVNSQGEREGLPDDPQRYSVVSKENDKDRKNSTKDWETGTPEHYKDARKHWNTMLNDPSFRADKLKQIQRSCPICRKMM